MKKRKRNNKKRALFVEITYVACLIMLFSLFAYGYVLGSVGSKTLSTNDTNSCGTFVPKVISPLNGSTTTGEYQVIIDEIPMYVGPGGYSNEISFKYDLKDSNNSIIGSNTPVASPVFNKIDSATGISLGRVTFSANNLSAYPGGHYYVSPSGIYYCTINGASTPTRISWPLSDQTQNYLIVLQKSTSIQPTPTPTKATDSTNMHVTIQPSETASSTPSRTTTKEPTASPSPTESQKTIEVRDTVTAAEVDSSVTVNTPITSTDINNKKEYISFSGKTDPNVIVVLYIFSDPTIVEVRTDKEGNWRYDLDKKKVAPGNHQVYVAVKDEDGKLVKRSNPVDFIVGSGEAIAASGNEKASTNAVQKSNSMLYYGIGVFALITLIVSIFLYIYAKNHIKRPNEQ
ncbi:hypothetical protein AUK11_02385 [bacterium CG2_30_37_16]|nr:MAG: hypothetical protein AUK11_02385 [bacterium CG2_30_37_16]PIP30257.1 MAG: hypothetical protein COX25_05535 [bacterium (Candidatus Howlettbacteria) CG23_combo_of_CG06-09_8_20_14_all_37_9]PJB06551.1 MAG: hypothetical protein CO123_01890 [bacterium (Candidatus Howlettbacteria) CG_4_9_14_3_um_filter_37_10]